MCLSMSAEHWTWLTRLYWLTADNVSDDEGGFKLKTSLCSEVAQYSRRRLQQNALSRHILQEQESPLHVK